MRQLRPRLVIIDSLKDVVSGKITSNFFATLVPRLDVLKALTREVGCAIGFAHHVAKNEDRQGTDAAISGTNTFIGSFPTRWIVKKLPANGAIRGMSVTRSIKRAAPLPTVLLRYTVAHERLCFDARTTDEEQVAALEAQNEKDQAILGAIRQRGEVGVNELHRALKERNVPMAKDTLIRRLARLQKSLHVMRTGNGKWKIGLDDSEVLDPETARPASTRSARTPTRPTTTRKAKKS